ncbi:MAG: hypothetical protein IB617_03085 [Candidatus Nealsonbacteria bacterium]|nr:MAG: hypothetical protein IB617_03085 [Candidatus Nealsonbacteria bacterium]
MVTRKEIEEKEQEELFRKANKKFSEEQSRIIHGIQVVKELNEEAAKQRIF